MLPTGRAGYTRSSAFAHHSHPLTYSWCKSVTVEGRVESVEYKNPHSILVVSHDDGTAYTVDWSSLVASPATASSTRRRAGSRSALE